MFLKIEDADWENEKCKICKRSVIRAKHGQFLLNFKTKVYE